MFRERREACGPVRGNNNERGRGRYQIGGEKTNGILRLKMLAFLLVKWEPVEGFGERNDTFDLCFNRIILAIV